MIIHHLNCGSFCPHVKFFKDISHCHCLLIENNNELILLDTGIGKNHRDFFMKFQTSIAGVKFNKFLSAKEQVLKLGFQVEDVKHIILTHLDYDHAGGLIDFPNAHLHIHEDELNAANKLKPFNRYSLKTWKNHKNTITYKTPGGTWNGFNAIKQLQGLPPEILMIPLPGHTKGHSGFAIKTKENWNFHVGDAYFSQSEMNTGISRLKYSAFARLNCVDNQLRTQNLRLIKTIRNKKKAVVFNSHDPNDFIKFKTD